jgi:uncharacterized membrane-anchored protein
MRLEDYRRPIVSIVGWTPHAARIPSVAPYADLGAAMGMRSDVVRHRETPPGTAADRGGSTASLVERLWAVPVAAKVPEIIALFWVVKVLTTAGGEATSDYLATFGNFVGGGVELLVFAIGLILQFGTTRYRAVAYWWLAYAIAIFGTGVADFLHLDLHIAYAGTTAMWSVILAVVFVVWHHYERTLSIHSIWTRRREFFYWSTVFATFALGTALGDYTAIALNLGFLGSGILFAVAIVIPGLACWKLGLNPVLAFWASYVLTRPLGASFADYVSKPKALGGLGFGNGPTAAVCLACVAVLVTYLAIVRPDIQRLPAGASD